MKCKAEKMLRNNSFYLLSTSYKSSRSYIIYERPYIRLSTGKVNFQIFWIKKFLFCTQNCNVADGSFLFIIHLKFWIFLLSLYLFFFNTHTLSNAF